jgi:hypothetical protein
MTFRIQHICIYMRKKAVLWDIKNMSLATRLILSLALYPIPQFIYCSNKLYSPPGAEQEHILHFIH